MTVEKFLSFWSQHNTAIIEGLVALIILFSLFLAYRTFFAKKDQMAGSESGAGLDTAQLEKTLQRILENQNQTAAPGRAAPVVDDLDIDVNLDESLSAKPAATAKGDAVVSEEVTAAVAAAAESAAEVAQLRLTLTESYQRVEALQAQIEALKASASTAAPAGEGSGAAEAGGMSAAEKAEMQGKLADLEARLAEYEIISEDIADLSRYREENDELKKQIEDLKSRGVSSAAAPASTPATEPVAPVEPESIVEEPAVTEAASAGAELSEADLMAELESAAASVSEPVAEAPVEAGSDLIDDDLMKEFAAAVAGQKAATKATEGGEQTAKQSEDADELLNEFENFVAKKS